MREHVLAVQRLWADDEAEFHGEHVDFEPCWSWPKPVQRPRPRTYLGGAAGPTLFRHVAELGDGWMPFGGSGLRAALPDLQRAVEERGRSFAEIDLVVFGAAPDPGKLDYYEGLGVHEIIFMVPTAPRDEVMPVLDHCTTLLAP
jgi:hypothetical protein